MDEIRIRGMQFFGRHGVLPQETELGQRFIVHLALRLDLAPAGRSDDLRDTVDYGKVYARVKRVVEGEPVKLIERVAERIAEELLAHYSSLHSVAVTVVKPNAPVAGVLDAVEVSIERLKPGR
ncbi:MAG: dihydroneopterin aldolase [Alicyclobacillus sp.]|nr:dihydroneopterin aldolase [Alicyclobacillus sp.]